MVGMQKSYNEGLANHIGPESCGSSGNTDIEALTGVRIGWVLSREMNTNFRVPTCFKTTEGNIANAGMARRLQTRRGRRPHACTETSCAGIGSPCIWPRVIARGPAWRTLRGYGRDEQMQGVGQPYSIGETFEQDM